ncbi:MAG: hypothetical protein NUW37_04930 [Planctomycetes bacterium]|nr:hypothetical protein [Planctomycetota bacterium]
MSERARRPYFPMCDAESLFKQERNVNLDTPRAVLSKKRDIDRKRTIEAGFVALNCDIEFDFALKVIDGQWFIERAKRESRKQKRKRKSKVKAIDVLFRTEPQKSRKKKEKALSRA